MNENDLLKLQKLRLLLDNAYVYYNKAHPYKRRVKVAEGSIRLEFGNHWWRRQFKSTSPVLENVVIFSSIFSAAKINYFDSLDEAIEVVNEWYEYAKALKQQSLD